MHTLGQYGYAFSMIMACLATIIASVIGIYAMIALMFASDVRIDNGRYYAVLPTSEISVNWQLPSFFAGAGCLWALIALGFHAL
jgi:hypothetical protein